MYCDLPIAESLNTNHLSRSLGKGAGMASSPLLVSRNCSYSNLCHAAKPDGHRLMHSQLVSILQQTSMKRSISAPCLAPASRFGTSHSGFEEHQACLLASRKSEMQEQTQQSTQADVERQQFQSHASSSIHSIKTPNFATDGRFASLSRVLLVSQPQNMFRSLANRKWVSPGLGGDASQLAI